jgi:hypothetical protein
MQINPAPDCKIGRGRITLSFRQTGASHWTQEARLAYAFRVAATARSILDADSRRAVRKRSKRAVVVIYEDTNLDQGCDVTSKWQCIVPSTR